MPTLHYEHVDITTRCSMGREFSVFQMSSNPLTICDRCDKAIRIRTIPTKQDISAKEAASNGKVSENPFVNAAFNYSPDGAGRNLPGPMQHPTPGNPLPPNNPPSNPGPLTE